LQVKLERFSILISHWNKFKPVNFSFFVMCLLTLFHFWDHPANVCLHPKNLERIKNSWDFAIRKMTTIPIGLIHKRHPGDTISFFHLNFEILNLLLLSPLFIYFLVFLEPFGVLEKRFIGLNCKWFGLA
jgi:hypothetical protein